MNFMTKVSVIDFQNEWKRINVSIERKHCVLIIFVCNTNSFGSYQQSGVALERADRSKGGYRIDYKFKLQYIHQNDIIHKVKQLKILTSYVLKEKRLFLYHFL